MFGTRRFDRLRSILPVNRRHVRNPLVWTAVVAAALAVTLVSSLSGLGSRLGIGDATAQKIVDNRRPLSELRELYPFAGFTFADADE